MKRLRAPREKNTNDLRNVLYVLLILISVCILTAVIVLWKLKSLDENVCSSRECLASSMYLLNLLATDVDPCENFYNFTCGKYKGHLLIQNYQQEIDKHIRGFTINAVQPNDSNSIKLQKQYYKACMNLSAIEEDQNYTLRKLFEKLGGWPVLKGEEWDRNTFDWGKIVDKCKDIGFYYDWFINIRNIDETVDENRMYITFPDNTNEIEKELKKSYVALMTNVVEILGAPGNLSVISEEMDRVVNFEIGLTKIIQDAQLNATNQKHTLEEIGDKYPNIPWSSLLKYAILLEDKQIMFSLDSYIPKLEAYLNATNKRDQANYIFWKLTESFSQFLSYYIRKEFKTYADLSEHYEYVNNRANYCYGITSTVFAYVSEAEFVREYGVEKNSVKEIVDGISFILLKHIDDAKWMTDDMKTFAFDKLHNMTVIIGGPDEMYNEENFNTFLGIDEISLSNITNTVDTICEVDRKRDIFNLNFNKPKLTIKQAQLYQGVTNLGFIKYMPDDNIMFLPAAVLNRIFYSPNRPNYLNYGAIGTIIGHELAHGFGLLGNLGLQLAYYKNDTMEHFINASKCLLEDCNNMGVENNINVQCRQTFEENFADYAGINLSYEAYAGLVEYMGKERSLPGLPYNSHQLFWMVYSSLMCNNMDIDNKDGFSHMLPFQRILGAFRNSEYFGMDFNCPVGSNMNPEVKCKIL